MECYIQALKMTMQTYTDNMEKFSKVWVEIKNADYKYHMNPILILKYICVHTQKYVRGKSGSICITVNNGSRWQDYKWFYFFIYTLLPYPLKKKLTCIASILIEKNKTSHLGRKRVIIEQHCQKLKFSINQTWVEIPPLPLTLSVWP